MLLRRFHDCTQTLPVADISRIDSDLVRARLNRRKRQSVVKVNIRYQRHFAREFFLYARENFCGLHIQMCIRDRTIIRASEKQDVRICELDSLQSVTSEDIDGGFTYLNAMKENKEVISECLN